MTKDQIQTDTIVVTGPESSGKSVLTQELSNHYKTVFTEEYARTYLEKNGPNYSYDDVILMMEQQAAIIHSARAESKGKFIFNDTDLLTYHVWFEQKYKKQAPHINALWKLPTLYILCYPDLAWKADPLRENPHDRSQLFIQYEQKIQSLNIPYIIITGQKRQRFSSARYHIDSIYHM